MYRYQIIELKVMNVVTEQTRKWCTETTKSHQLYLYAENYHH